MADPTTDCTRLLNRMAAGDRAAGEELMPIVYGELRGIAGRHLARHASDLTLEPTGLIHEAWMKLARQEELEFGGRAQFYSLASRVMRSVLVDHVRARHAKRPAGRRESTLAVLAADEDEVDVTALDEVLERLETFDAELAKLVELRFFGGLSHPRIAETLGVPLRRVERRWRLARAWLRKELDP